MGGIDNDVLRSIRDRAKPVADTVTSKLTKAEIREATFSADARKARDLVKAGAFHSLPDLAAGMMSLILDGSLKSRLGAALEELAEANAEYRRVEELPAAQMVAWMGGHGLNNGILQPLPDWAPDHKKRMAKAWNTLLITVNEITKVGVLKRDRGRPIELQVDVDLTEQTRVQVQGHSGDGW